MGKVDKAVEAFQWLDGAQEEFNEAFSELSEAQIKEFEERTGATINKKIDDPEQEIKRLQQEIKNLRHGIDVALSHTVSYQFIDMYRNGVDKEQKEEWVGAVYVKEILAYAKSTNGNKETKKDEP